MPERSRLRRFVEARWQAAAPHPLLRPLGALHGVVGNLRRLTYRAGLLPSRHPGVPVVVVGNVTVGGTGKTPLVLWLARQLQDAGLRPGIALRGYGGTNRHARRVTAEDDPGLVGDEAVLLARRSGCPVAVGVQRVAAASLLRAAGCGVVLCDDGLQHLALRRDLEIAVVDAARAWGNGALLPAGPLRESPARLAAVQAVVLNGTADCPLPAGAPRPLRMTLEPLALHALLGGARADLHDWRGRAVHAVAGIGNPERFFAQLRAEGLAPIAHPFPDHHRFRAADLQFGDDLPVVMTEKDAVKCAAFAADHLWYLPVEAHLSAPDAAHLLRQVLAVTSARSHSRA